MGTFYTSLNSYSIEDYVDNPIYLLQTVCYDTRKDVDIFCIEDDDLNVYYTRLNDDCEYFVECDRDGLIFTDEDGEEKYIDVSDELLYKNNYAEQVWITHYAFSSREDAMSFGESRELFGEFNVHWRVYVVPSQMTLKNILNDITVQQKIHGGHYEKSV